MNERIVIAITGASGVIYGIRALQVLRDLPNVETHLVMSAAAKQTIAAETDWTIQQVEQLAHVTHDDRQIGATIASGSFATRGMIVMPCSIKTLSAIANSFSADLIARAADVTLKEGRPLILVVRETPFHLGHLRLMERAAEMGAIIAPPIPTFYSRPQTLAEMIDGTVGRVLARLGFDNALFTQWAGMRDAVAAPTETSTQDKIIAFLAAQTTLTLATTNADGSPHACDVFYAHDDARALYFLSDPKTRHIQNLQRDARVHATVHAATRGWQTIRGLQIAGDAQRVPDDERARGYELYVRKFPFVKQWLPAAAMLGRALDKLGVIEMHKIVPKWIRWIDNAEGFGHKEEMSL
ncbi:MAG: UbiX family flavin prenyltransferase [Chloroflexi bacterium]|nr:UbiX family flavin prenyltransferase [Chloroflexota bacterium]